MADTSYLLFGQEYTESQGRMMARVFEELLNRRPDLVPEALRQFPCLAAIDYTQNSEALRKARPAFLNKRTFQAGGRRLCIGTSYNLSQKRAFISRLFQLCGEDEGQFVPLEGPSDPENTPQPPAGERRPPQEPLMYRLFDQVYQSNQTAMMYRAFYEILGRKPELIDWAVEHLKCVKDLTGPRSGEPVRPTSYFQTQRFLEVNDRTLCLGTACNLKAKQRLIDRLLCQAGFSEDVFQIYDSVPSLHLRSWQKEAAEAAYAGLFASLRSSGPAGILSIPAGAGKTIIMAELLRRCPILYGAVPPAAGRRLPGLPGLLQAGAGGHGRYAGRHDCLHHSQASGFQRDRIPRLVQARPSLFHLQPPVGHRGGGLLLLLRPNVS